MSTQPPMDPALARSAAFWLRAYPPRWRGAQGDGGLGLVADLVPHGAHRVPPRIVLELVRGGWSYRAQHRPGPGAWFLYRFFDAPITGHDAWLLDDIDGRLYSWRRGYLAWLVLGIQGAFAINDEWRSSPAWMTWSIAVAIAVVGGVVMAGPSRRAARARHLSRPDPGPAQPPAQTA